jgi:hypothetical protein
MLFNEVRRIIERGFFDVADQKQRDFDTFALSRWIVINVLEDYLFPSYVQLGNSNNASNAMPPSHTPTMNVTNTQSDLQLRNAGVSYSIISRARNLCSILLTSTSPTARKEVKLAGCSAARI